MGAGIYWDAGDFQFLPRYNFKNLKNEKILRILLRRTILEFDAQKLTQYLRHAQRNLWTFLTFNWVYVGSGLKNNKWTDGQTVLHGF